MADSNRYQLTLIVVMFLLAGTVILDRTAVLFLSPFIIRDLHLAHEQVGLLAAATAVAWAVCSFLFGALSDRIGRRVVLIPMVFIFSAMSWLSGLAHTFGSLLLIRAVMGGSEGAAFGVMAVAVGESSPTMHRGRNVGIVLSGTMLLGAALGPVVLTHLAQRFGWRMALILSAMPGLILGVVLLKIFKEPLRREKGPRLKGSVLSVLGYRNVWLTCLASVGYMMWVWVMNAFAPSYLTEIAKQPPTTAGYILGAFGLGGFLWGFLVPTVSDWLGRRPTLAVAAAFATVVPLSCLIPAFAHRPLLLALVVLTTNLGQALVTIVHVLIPVESVPPALAATAVGLSSLVGEIVGGAIAPAFGGVVADRYGLATPLWIAAAGSVLVFVTAFAMKETSPGRLAWNRDGGLGCQEIHPELAS